MDVRRNTGQKNTQKQDKQQSDTLTFKSGSATNASAALMLPKPISTKLTEISTTYGLPLDIGAIGLRDATPENVKTLRQITSLMGSNSQLLPEILKLIKQLLKAEIQLSAFHREVTKSALKHQEAIDQDTANIFLEMAGYSAKAGKLQHRVNTRKDLIAKRTQAYINHQKQSIFGNQSEIIDTEYQLLASNSRILKESKVNRMEANSERRQAAQAYIDKAFVD